MLTGGLRTGLGRAAGGLLTGCWLLWLLLKMLPRCGDAEVPQHHLVVDIESLVAALRAAHWGRRAAHAGRRAEGEGGGLRVVLGCGVGCVCERVVADVQAVIRLSMVVQVRAGRRMRRARP